MNSSGNRIIFDAQSTAATTTVPELVDENRIVLLEVSGGAGTPSGQRLYVYGAIGANGIDASAVDITQAAGPTNRYSALNMRDLNDLSVIVGTDGAPISANTVNLYEVNVDAVSQLYFKLSGSNVPVTVIMRPYRHV